ncbi:MAG TPA: CoA-binding protein [Acidimicrobiales bacterium]|nr:CoA-binding protein [Acidimicrobiales bacterium]
MSDPRQMLEAATTIAVVGASTTPGKAAYAIPRTLLAAGFRMIPVHLTASEIHGQRVYPRLAEIPEPVDLVDVFRPAAEAPGVARQAVAIGAKGVWLQLGIISAEARSIAEGGGLEYIEDLCIGVEVVELGIVKKGRA